MSQYDSNNDGVIDEKDEVYSKLLVWQDKNSNGISEADELKSLKDIGITSVSLAAEESGGVKSSLINYADGTGSKVGEFSFDAQLYNTKEKEKTEISEEIEKLPDVQAIGNVASLHTLMEQDKTGTLTEYINRFANSTDDSEKSNLVTNILYYITGADKVTAGSRGSEFDAKKLCVIEEAFMGRGFIGTEGSNPVNTAATILNGLYNNIFELYYNVLSGQTTLKNYLAMSYITKDEYGREYIDTTLFDAYMDICSKQGMDIKNTVRDMGRYILSVNSNNKQNFADYLEKYSNNSEIIAELNKLVPAELIMGSKADDTLNGKDSSDSIFGGDGNDTLNGCNRDEEINGGAGDDVLYGKCGNDHLYGGTGNDTLNGEEGNDTYYFKLGDGEDIINEDSNYVNSQDRIVFGEGICISDVKLERVNEDLIIKHSETDKITVKNAYRYKYDYGHEFYFVENIEFADGTVWDKSKIMELASIYRGTQADDIMKGYGATAVYNQNETFYGGDGNDTINAGDGNDLIYGGAGNDVINAGTGNDKDEIHGEAGDDIINAGNGSDHLYGGSGNDILNGGEGEDTYYFNLGDGEDIINEDSNYANCNDKIVFGEGIRTSDIKFERINTDLIIRYSETDRITVKNAYGYKYDYGNEFYYVESIEFANGTIWNLDKIRSQPSRINGTDGNDTINGYESGYNYNTSEIITAGAGDDTINAGSGNDTINAGAGNDIVNAGTGNDTVFGASGNDTIHGNDGTDYLNAGQGDDVVYGDNGNDTLDGGVGNDKLYGGAGNDTYIFGKKYGTDIISDNSGSNTISFNSGITIEDVLLSRDSNNLEMQLSGTEDKLIIENYFYSSDYQNFTGSFADGTSLDKDDFTAMLDGTYVYETTMKQSQMLANELASMSVDGNVAESGNYSTVNNANAADTQIWVNK